MLDLSKYVIPTSYLYAGAILFSLALAYALGRWHEDWRSQFEECPVCRGTGKIHWLDHKDEIEKMAKKKGGKA